MRIDLLLKSRCGFSYETHAANKIVEAFEKRKIPYKKIFLCDGVLQDYTHYVREDPPFQMVSFDPILPYEIPFCDFVHVPQFMWAKNSLSEAAHFLTSNFGTIGLPTPTELPKTVYLPHGVDVLSPKKRLFDVVFFSPLVDVACLKERWEEFFPQETIEFLEKALPEVAEGHSSYEILKTAPVPVSMCHAIEAIEEYLKAERACRVIFGCRGYKLDMFGEHIGSNWYRRLPNSGQVHLHAPLPYSAHFDVLAQSKIVILDPLDASWTLSAAAAGCLPLLADEADLHEQIAQYLADSERRKRTIESYQEQIQNRTWENQTTQLIHHFYEN